MAKNADTQGVGLDGEGGSRHEGMRAATLAREVGLTEPYGVKGALLGEKRLLHHLPEPPVMVRSFKPIGPQAELHGLLSHSSRRGEMTSLANSSMQRRILSRGAVSNRMRINR